MPTGWVRQIIHRDGSRINQQQHDTSQLALHKKKPVLVHRQREQITATSSLPRSTGGTRQQLAKKIGHNVQRAKPYG